MASFASFDGNQNDLLRDWRWLLGDDHYALIAISPFGDLLLRDQLGAVSLLDINVGTIELATTEDHDPALLFPVAFDDRLARSYRRAQLFLKPNTCYGYKIQGVMGGSFEVDNVYVATLSEYVSFMGNFHFQIRDVADGESVVIKVIRPLPN